MITRNIVTLLASETSSWVESLVLTCTQVHNIDIDYFKVIVPRGISHIWAFWQRIKIFFDYGYDIVELQIQVEKTESLMSHKHIFLYCISEMTT